MPSRDIKITVITVNYNTADNTLRLLDSLKTQVDTDFKLIVVDNHSEPADLQKLRDYISGSSVHLMENSANLGFSGGNNRAIYYSFEQMDTQWVLLLNSDTVVKPDFISTLKSNLIARTGLIGLPINEGDAVAFGGQVRWLSRPSKRQHIYQQELNRSGRYIVGAALLISREAFQQLGALDEQYFLYYEDADYCAQARRKHVSISYLTRPIVYHSVSYTTRKLGPAMLMRYQYRNALYFNQKNGPWWIRLFVPVWALQIKLKQQLKIVLNYNSVISRAILAGVYDYEHGNMGRIES